MQRHSSENSTDPPVRLGWYRRWPYLLGGLVIFLVGLWVKAQGGLEGVSELAFATIHDLSLFTPLDMLGTYIGFVNPCHDIRDFRGGFVRSDCNYWHLVNPLIFIGAFLNTLWAVWSESSGPGYLIFPAIMLAAIPITASMILSLQRRLTGVTAELNVLNGAAIAVTTPLVASLTAFGFKWIAVGVLYAFGAIASLLVTLLTVFGWLIFCLRAPGEINSYANMLERFRDILNNRRKKK